jgi:hypothetical protein
MGEAWGRQGVLKKLERRRNRLPEGWLQEFIQAYDIKSTDELKGALADLVGDTVETMMQAGWKLI